MMVNASKTELLLCGDRHQLALLSESSEIMFMEEILQDINNAKIIGVMMDCTLS